MEYTAMAGIPNYEQKFNKIVANTMFSQLSTGDQSFVQNIANRLLFTQQELRLIIEKAVDLSAWQEENIKDIAPIIEQDTNKKTFLVQLSKNFEAKKTKVVFKKDVDKTNSKAKKITLKERKQSDKVLGQCPVASEKTVCCNLITIDAVRNCGFGCNYCGIQTMFNDQEIMFDPEFEEKLMATKIDSSRYYHFGTGQSSDALMWGNKHGILDSCIKFANTHPNVLVEFKTKSHNVKHLLDIDCPKNIVCSWSLNPDVFIENEEKLTASLDQRINAARKVADKGIKVSFHFHPIVVFENWKEEYAQVFKRIKNEFKPEEILFISFGTMTLPKPVIKKIRKSAIKTKVLQMPFMANPEGKLSYPDKIKNDMFSFAYTSFSEWHDKVFFYLCMEDPKFWIESFGYVYEKNTDFEDALLKSSFSKINI